jgi:3-hydroxy-3-methylglutaryl CoA synthase
VRDYNHALAACYARLRGDGGANLVEAAAHVVFHLGSSPKFVWHAFEALCATAFDGDPRCDSDFVAALFAEKVAPSLRLAARIGPMHTAALYANLASLCLEGVAAGATVLCFSYGSGSVAAMFGCVCESAPRVNDVHAMLDARTVLPPDAFDRRWATYEATYGRVGWAPTAAAPPPPPAPPREIATSVRYAVARCDEHGVREYTQTH